ncbi:MAG: hypothetical protein ACLR56_07565 [Oscillospiraceae bacterium]
MHIINSIGDAVDPMTTRIILENCIESGIISAEAALLPRRYLLLFCRRCRSNTAIP